MSLKTTLITAADSGYFSFACDMFRSVRRFPQASQLELAVLDVGLTPQQAQDIASLVDKRVVPGWDLDFPQRPGVPTWYRAMVSRPHLPKYLPESELIIWIDADAWLSNWDAIAILLGAGEAYGFAIVPEIDRSYRHTMHPGLEAEMSLRETYNACYAPEGGEKFATLPIINSGVFAMRRDVPHWGVWAEILNTGLQRTVRLLTEQCALNIGIFQHRIRAHFLPSWCNWSCGGALPLLHKPTREILVPMAPHERISIVHMVGIKDKPQDIPCTDGSILQMPLTYSAVHTSEPYPSRGGSS